MNKLHCRKKMYVDDPDKDLCLQIVIILADMTKMIPSPSSEYLKYDPWLDTWLLHSLSVHPPTEKKRSIIITCRINLTLYLSYNWLLAGLHVNLVINTTTILTIVSFISVKSLASERKSDSLIFFPFPLKFLLFWV